MNRDMDSIMENHMEKKMDLPWKLGLYGDCIGIYRDIVLSNGESDEKEHAK